MKGTFASTFTLTDIATGWTEWAPLLVREQTLEVVIFIDISKLMPFVLLRFVCGYAAQHSFSQD